MSNPKVSIGLPVLNGAPYLDAAIQSLLSQKFKDFELIISDNGSSDSTPQIIEKYALLDARIKYLNNPKNFRGHGQLSGLYNFEFVKDKAKGQYFMWAAHDDTWHKDHLSLAVAALDDDTEIKFVFPTFILQSIHLAFYKKINKSVFKFMESSNEKERLLGFANLHHASHKSNLVYSLFKKEFLDSVYKLQNMNNDGLLAALLVGKGKAKVLDTHTFRKRYPFYWPGFFLLTVYLIKRLFYIDSRQSYFQESVQNGIDKLVVHFPSYETELRAIGCEYRLDRYNSKFQIKPKLKL